MHSTIVKKIFLFLSIFIVVALACDLAVTVAPPTSTVSQPTNTTIPELGNPTEILVSPTSISVTAVPAAAIPTIQRTSSAGTEVTFGSLTLVIPSEVADGASGSEYPRIDSDDAPWWQKTPGHLQVMLGDYYVLQGKFHQPQIYVYPATEYAVLVPAAFESMHRLRNVMYTPSASISADQLPAVPFFNASQVFASNFQPISFQNGSGVRFLTEYAQYAAPVNNQDLFYHFQGFSDDGEYYVVAILPVTVPVLAETSDAGAVLPPGGVPYPDITNTDVEVQGYYASVTDLLNATSPDAFAPSLNQLDALIRSIQIIP